MTQIFPLQNLQVVHHLLIKTGRSAHDSHVRQFRSSLILQVLHTDTRAAVCNSYCQDQTMEFLLTAISVVHESCSKDRKSSRINQWSTQENLNWETGVSKKKYHLWLTFEFLPVRFKEFKGMVGSSAVNKQRTNTIKMRDSFTEGTGRGAWCPRLQKHYDRKWHFLLSSSYLHVWVWQTGCVNCVCSFVPFTK